jgi:flavin reductase (DIM6/NTAB) family NADH-FMN oxidoreductase RutF
VQERRLAQLREQEPGLLRQLREPLTAFDELVAQLDYPMLIATTVAGGERAGCLVGFATQCSIDPPRFLVCISDKNRTYRVLEGGATAMVVHVVPGDAGYLVELFGGETGDEADKFDRCQWSPGPEGIPVLDLCRSWFAGRIVDRAALGDHVGFVLEPFDGRAEQTGAAFPFSRARHLEPGHEA